MNAAIDELHQMSHIGTGDFNGFPYLSTLKLAKSYCNHPVRVPMAHRYRKIQAYVYRPCGTCEQCRNTKGNDLSIRFFHDAHTLQHAYFVTLTYPSFQYVKDIPPTLYPLFWHKDCNNFNKTQLWSPCLLYYPHVQSFLKLLRTRVSRAYSLPSFTLEFLCTGELGHRYGRPHWHILFISDVSLPFSEIKSAWTDTIKAEARVDFEDLISNGTLYAREDVSRPTNAKRNTKRAVKYVVKYTTKSDYRHANTSRLEYTLPFFQSNVRPSYVNTPDSLYLPNKYHHEKEDFIKQDPHPSSAHNFKSRVLDSNDEIGIKHLYSMFGTHRSSSTAHAIGKVYAMANRERFATGSKKLLRVPCYTPTLHANQKPSTAGDSAFLSNVFPAYFNKITQRYLLPLQVCYKIHDHSTQSSTFTLHHYNALCRLWDDYYHLFMSLPDFALQQSAYYDFATLEDFKELGIILDEEQKALLFPDESDKHFSRVAHPDKVFHVEHCSFKAHGVRYRFGVVFNEFDRIGICLLAQRYDRSERCWTIPRLASPKVFYNAGLLPLMANQKEYNQSFAEQTKETEILDALIGTGEWLKAIEDNKSDWEHLKSSKDSLTKQRNAYD